MKKIMLDEQRRINDCVVLESNAKRFTLSNGGVSTAKELRNI